MANNANNNEKKGNSKFINDLLKYKQDIVDALKNPKSNSNKMFENDQRSKNAMIMSAMFDNCDEITMYCGEMAIFRKCFYQNIENASEEDKKSVRKIVKDSLDRFISKNPKLTIIVEDFKEQYLDELISDELKSYKNLFIRKIDKDRVLTSVLSHTALGKKNNHVVIRRREINSQAYKARCMVNLESKISDDAIKLMSYIEEASDPIKMM